VTHRVFRHTAAPVTLGSQLLLPVLDAAPRAWLWGTSAARWWGFSRDRDPTVHVARVDGKYPNPLGRIHQIRRLDPCDVTVHHGIPVARPERVLLTLAAHETRRYKPSRLRDRRHGEDIVLLTPAIRKLARITDHAWSLGLVDPPFIHEMVERLSRQGRAGIVVMREVLRHRGADYVAPESGNEQRFEAVIGDLVASLDRQVVVNDARGLIGRVDYLARAWPLVIEINGELHHVTLTDRASDSARYERLLAAGYSVLVVWQYDVWHRPRQVRGHVRRLMQSPDRAPTVHRPTAAPWELLAGEAGRTVRSLRPAV
jgi:very-short-patch-repair endonuclease